MTTAINHNLAIWSAVEKTDPAHTKTFSRAGGFSGTAVNQAYQARRATELFGPVGIGWGFDEIEHTIVDGAAGDKVWFAKVKLWYQHDGRRGEVIQWGATTFVGRNKNGAFTDEEAAKKSITDAVGKCLSLLGFSADVYLGQFDDQKYVNDRRREEASKKQAGGRRQTVDGDAQASAAPPGQPKATRTSREASPPPAGNGHAPASSPSPSTVYHLPPTSLDAFREAIAAAETVADAQRAEWLYRDDREQSGRPLSEIEASLVTSCTEAACERIQAAKEASGVRRRASGNGQKQASGPQNAARQASGKNGRAAAPDLAAIATSGPVSGEHLMQPRGSGTAHPHKNGALGLESSVLGASGGGPGSEDRRPKTKDQLAPDIAAFREFCAQALSTVDVKRGEHVLRSKRLRDRIGLGDAESELIAGWADAACRRIRAARKGRSDS